MSDPRITDEAVEAAERAYVKHWRDRVPAAGAGMRAALEAALPHLAPQPVVDRDAAARPDWRQLVWAEMSHRGYTDDEIKAAERQRCADTCEWDGNSLRWDCFDEDGKSNHPAADELAEIAGVIERVLDSDAVLALLNGGAK